jgi:hypothetical protein
VHHVEVACTNDGETLATARTLVLRGSSYGSESEATAAGQLWRSRLMLVFAHSRVGADFGDRAGHSFVTTAGLKTLVPGRRALNDKHGLMVFECEPRPVFVGAGNVSLMTSRSHEELIAAMRRAQRTDGLGEREQVAYDLLSTAMSETSVDARFALLMMAIESLIELQVRSVEARTLVDGMIESVVTSDLSRSEVDSLVGSLRWLRAESIGQAGRRLATTLEPRRYLDRSPASFFSHCYAMRGRLFHGQHPLPARDEVAMCAGTLEIFVANLVSSLGDIPPA